MSKKGFYIRLNVSLVFALLLTLPTAAQHFFNLTYKEVRADSLLPYFRHAVPLGPSYADSIYTVTIDYPDFIPMPEADVLRYHQAGGKVCGSLPQITTHVSLDQKKPCLQIGFIPIVYRNGKYQYLVSFKLGIHARATQKPLTAYTRASRAATSPASRYAEHSVLSNGHWAKIRVKNTGVCRLTDEVIRRAGFNDPSKVSIYGYGGALQPEVLTDEYLRTHDDLKEIPSCRINGRRLFFAVGSVNWSTATATDRERNPYSDYGYYFITESQKAPLMQDTAAFKASIYPQPHHYHHLLENDDYAWFAGGRNLFDAHPIAKGQEKKYSLSANGKPCKAKLTVAVTAGNATMCAISLGGVQIGEQTIKTGHYDKGGISGKTYDIQLSDKPLEVSVKTIAGGPARLDYLQLTTTEPQPPHDLAHEDFQTAEFMGKIENQDLHAHTPVEMIIIIPTSQKWRAEAERLAAFHHEQDGMSVRVVRADQIYNEFASGTPDATAYRRYLKMLYDKAGSQAQLPRYLLLFGDCAWDNRMRIPVWQYKRVDDYLLCYESQNSFSEVNCYVDDGYFTLLDDGEGAARIETDKEDIAVGRLPVTTPQEARVVVDKTIAYHRSAHRGVWCNRIVVMGDDGDQNQHMADANYVADEIVAKTPGFEVKKIMWDTYKRESSATGHTYPAVTATIRKEQSAGALIMNYTGHGRPDQISHESVLKIGDFQTFTGNNLPLWVTASCDIMPFDGTVQTIGEQALLNPNGGAVAFWGTTRTVYAYYNKLLNHAYMQNLLKLHDGQPITIGEAQRLAKNDMVNDRLDLTENKLQFSLLGDPALRLHIPTLQVNLDSIDGKAILSDAKHNIIHGGKPITISGHIHGDSYFTGTMDIIIKNGRRQVECKANDPKIETPFTYQDHTSILYAGKDSVVNGRFRITILIPTAMRQDTDSGLILLYATDGKTGKGAHGVSENITIAKGQAEGGNGVGPMIYAYLNSPDFANGGQVNATPHFQAQITDEDGINTTGNGIGRDLLLTIDNDKSKSYILNDYFRLDFGKYTSGTVSFTLPPLTTGRHTLQFRAWDALGNPGSTTLDFEVVADKSPDRLQISAAPNPASDHATFIIDHDRIGVNSDITIQVYDTTGRMVWHHTHKGVRHAGTYTVDWDLTHDHGGRIMRGIYLYRAIMTVEGTTKTSTTHKLIVI